MLLTLLTATPGRLLDHLKKTRGFDELTFARLRFLVIDEADRMLGTDFDSVLERILCVLPSQRQTFLFSATMTSKVGVCLRARFLYFSLILNNARMHHHHSMYGQIKELSIVLLDDGYHGGVEALTNYCSHRVSVRG